MVKAKGPVITGPVWQFAVCGTAVGSTPSTFDTPETKATATPARREKTASDALHSADDAQPTHNPEPVAASGKFT